MTRTNITALGWVATILVLGGWSAMDSAGGSSAKRVDMTIQIDGKRDRAEVVQNSDGSFQFVIQRFDGSIERLSPDQFAAQLHGERAPGGGWLGVLFNISTPIGIVWVSLGLLGQLLFTARMLVQWLTSERHRRSIVPPAFWWLSLIGASMLLAYFIWRRDVVGVIGQAFGWIVYVRNIHLIYFGRGRVTAATDPAPQPELTTPMFTVLESPRGPVA
jgi:lipid-A-disaccharide synthase-like uncharacterized protein